MRITLEGSSSDEERRDSAADSGTKETAAPVSTSIVRDFSFTSRRCCGFVTDCIGGYNISGKINNQNLKLMTLWVNTGASYRDIPRDGSCCQASERTQGKPMGCWRWEHLHKPVPAVGAVVGTIPHWNVNLRLRPEATYHPSVILFPNVTRELPLGKLSGWPPLSLTRHSTEASYVASLPFLTLSSHEV